MATHLRLRSLAKINLDLRVLNKRPDSYHELRTIFQTISLADTIDVEYRPGPSRIEIKSNLNIPDNLIVRAADNVMKATHRTGRIGFVLRKRIPLGAGLGGGSSNAAAVLLALPVLLKRPLPLEKLLELAAGLGSDVPFFLLGGAVIGLGRGTELYPLPDVPSRPIVVVAPGIHVSTAAAYSMLSRESAPSAPTSAINSFQAATWQASDGVNDFERVVFRLHPQLKSIKGKLLNLGARPALMSGSGSALFGIFPSRVLRDRAVDSLTKELGKDRVHSVAMISRRRYRALWCRQLAAPVDSKVWPPQDRYAG